MFEKIIDELKERGIDNNHIIYMNDDFFIGKPYNKSDFFYEENGITMQGFLGTPVLNRSNRNFENYFINHRFVKNEIIAKGIETGYKAYLMQHKFPFVSLHIEMEGNDLDVNVHPSKMELRFRNQEYLYEEVQTAVRKALTGGELSPNMVIDEPKKKEETKNTAVKQENFLEDQVKTEKEERKINANIRNLIGDGSSTSDSVVDQEAVGMSQHNVDDED